ALRDLGAKPIGDLADAQPGAARDNGWGPAGPKPIEPDTSVGGIIAACRPLKTRKGDRMAVFTLEDAQGSVEIVAFPEAYRRAAPPAPRESRRRCAGSRPAVADAHCGSGAAGGRWIGGASVIVCDRAADHEGVPSWLRDEP